VHTIFINCSYSEANFSLPVDCNKGDSEILSLVVALSIVFLLDSSSSLTSPMLLSILSSIMLEVVAHFSSFKIEDGFC